MAAEILATMLRVTAFFVVMLLLTFSVMGAELPNSKLTPGEANPVLTQDKVCNPKFRTGPYRNVPASLKNKVYAAYGAKNHEGVCAGKEGCEVDHLESIEIGGANTLKNLWPEPYSGKNGAHTKDKLENRLHKIVCNGTITLRQAQLCISQNWKTCFQKYMP